MEVVTVGTLLNAIEAKEVVLTLDLKQSIAQRKNILKVVFSGQLVPQNSSDEPASALLERIRAERKERETQLKTRTILETA